MLLSDKEVICEFMKPGGNTAAEQAAFWWCHISGGRRMTKALTLDALWEVEERLIRDFNTAWCVYRANLETITCAIHATAAQKIKALATILR